MTDHPSWLEGREQEEETTRSRLGCNRTLERAFAHEGPSLVEVLTDPELV